MLRAAIIIAFLTPASAAAQVLRVTQDGGVFMVRAATNADLAALSEQLRLDTIASSSQGKEVIQSAVDAAPSSVPLMTNSAAAGGAAFTYYRPAVCSGGNCGRSYTPVRRFRLFGRR